MKLLSYYTEHKIKTYKEIVNWENYNVSESLVYSYRDTLYDEKTYPSNLHYHDYYELVIFEDGDINYICEGCVYTPKYGDIILIPPRKFHMSLINSETTRYKRHVFYLYPSAFDFIGHKELVTFLTRITQGDIFTFDSLNMTKNVMDILERLKETLKKEPDPLSEALGLSYVVQIFYLLNQKSLRLKNETSFLPENILLLQKYIDDNFSTISSVSQLAEHFFYSREHVSRLFRKYFNITISDYIIKRRIARSQLLISQGMPITAVAYECGFGSLSTFIRKFKSINDITPSEYRKLKNEFLT